MYTLVFYLAIVNKYCVTVTFVWHDSSTLQFEMFIFEMALVYSLRFFLHTLCLTEGSAMKYVFGLPKTFDSCDM